MPLLQWTNDYSVGVGSMDRHHQKLFDILNKLHDAMSEGKATEVITGTLQELLNYTEYHFAEEEKLLEQISYVGLAEQKNAHQRFIQDVEKYKAQAESGMAAFLSSGISTLLTDWLKKHIGMTDKKYEKEMNAGGIT